MLRNKLWLFKKNKSMQLGLAQSSNTVSYVLAKHYGNCQRIVEYGQVDGDDVEIFLNQLRKKTDNLCCRLVLPHQSMIIRKLSLMQGIKEYEIEQILSLNAEKYFSCQLEKILFDYEYLPFEKNSIRVLACKKEDVSAWIKLFKDLQLKLTVITADVLSLEQFLTYYGLIAEETSTAIFYLQKNFLLQTIIQCGIVHFSNTTCLEEISCRSVAIEMQKFLRLYEQKNHSQKTVRTIFFAERSSMPIQAFDDVKIDFYYLSDLRGIERSLPLYCLLPLGVCLPC